MLSSLREVDEALTERGIVRRLKAMVKADPRRKPEDTADRVTAAANNVRGSLIRREWRRGIGWLATVASVTADVADDVAARTGYGDAEPVLQASDKFIAALDRFKMSLPEARAVVWQTLAG